MSATLIRPLTADERAELDDRVQAVFGAMFAFGLATGEHLYQIHRKRLYRERGTFEAFVWETFHFRAKRAYQFIQAYRVYLILKRAGLSPLPEREAHCRPLYRLLSEPARVVKAWKGVIRSGSPSAKRVSTIVDSAHLFAASETGDGDFFPTPLRVVRDLFERERFTGTVWDCAAGDGRVIRFAKRYFPGPQHRATDITTGVDFLTTALTAPNIVTNPPYSRKDEFVQKAMERATRKIAMLLPLDFLSGVERYRTVHTHTVFRLATVWIYAERLQFLKGKNAHFPVGWFVWERGRPRSPVIKWIEVA